MRSGKIWIIFLKRRDCIPNLKIRNKFSVFCGEKVLFYDRFKGRWKLKKAAEKFLIFLIRVYQRFLSPLKGPTCRFYPTCSEYSVQAIRKYGPFKGTYLSVRRILKCHPFHEGGYDPLK